MSSDAIDRLTERQRQCLRMLFDHYKPGEIAARLGISTDRVNQHLKAARDRLGVNRSIDAARILAIAENRHSHVVGPPDVGLASRPDGGDDGASSGKEKVQQAYAILAEAHASYDAVPAANRERPFWPVSTPRRPFNDLTWYQKLAWALAVALGATVLAGAMVSLQNAIH